MLICVDAEMLKSIVKQLAADINADPADDWINEKEAMGILDIASKTTFQKYRDSGEIIYSVVSGKKYTLCIKNCQIRARARGFGIIRVSQTDS